MIKASNLFIDFLNLLFLAAFSFVAVSFLLQGELLDPGYEDWMAHAFRIKVLDQFGYTSWIHTWSNGISVWSTYQFIPHYITLGIANVFDLTITKAMIYITVGQFILLRFIIYIVLRLLFFSKLTSFIIALLSMSIAHYWGGVNDFSLLFAFTVFPILLYLWVLYYKEKISYLFVYLIGLSFYVHPLLGMSLMVLWFFANLFSSKIILSKRLFVELLIILLTSSLFWLPIIQSSNFTFANPYSTSKEFAANILSPYDYYGINLFICILFLTTLPMLLVKQKKVTWIKILFLYTVIYLFFIILSTKTDIPKIIAQTQLSRGATFVGISMLFVSAVLIETIFKSKHYIFKITAIAIVTVAFVDALWYATVNSPAPLQESNDPVYHTYKQNIQDPFADGRVWSSNIGSSSYYADADVKFSYSYMGHLEPNQIAQRLGQYLLYTNPQQSLTKSSADTINSYLELTGTKYLLLDHNNEFTKSFIDNNAQSIERTIILRGKKIDYNYIIMDFEPINAYALTNNQEPLPKFPHDVNINTEINQKRLDDLVIDFNNTLKMNTPINIVSYPKNDQINIELTDNISSRYIFVKESYDPNWKGIYNDKQVTIQSSGPNFMLVDLGEESNGGTLYLKHSWPLTHWLSLFLIVMISTSLLIVRMVERIKKIDEVD